ncbi:MAG: GNAT family N-acetyltransferase [Deltaproteobacteria bacterium]|nr:GNAT family N-acetyltransferase [Deltaproteobacteria bacterium]
MIALRPYREADLDTAVAMWRRSMRTAYPYVAEIQRHSADDDRTFFRDHVAVECAVELAEVDGRIAGLLAQRGEWVDQLFVDVDHQRRGVGSTLLDAAKRRAPTGLRLFTFRRNAPARAFYARHGFGLVGFGVSPAPENAPDVELAWPAARVTPPLQLDTPFTELVGCAVPIQLAGMPGIASPELATAVAGAGALAMIGGAMLPATRLDATLRALRSATRGAIGVTFLMPFLDPDCVPVAARQARVVEFFYGAPDARLVERVHAGDALASWQVGSLDEARAAVDAGCDLIVAQGTEAGGHVRGSEPLRSLLDAVCAAVSVPVVAAGGITSGADLAAVLGAGAAAARLGTRFVTASESGAHPDYAAALLAARGEHTVLTTAFAAEWPDAPHRVLHSAIAAAEAFAEPLTGSVDFGGATLPLPRWSVFAPTRETRGAIAAMALYAGAGVGGIAARQPAGVIVREMVEDAVRRRGGPRC